MVFLVVVDKRAMASDAWRASLAIVMTFSVILMDTAPEIR
jgi:hypothetical protein